MDNNLTLSEKAAALTKIFKTGRSRAAQPGISLEEAAKSLGLPPKKEIIAALLKIGQLSPELVRAVDQKKINLVRLPDLIKKNRTDQESLARMVFAYPLNANLFNEFWEMIEETGRREKLGTARIIEELGLLKIAAEKSPADARIKKARKKLLVRRYPEFSRYLEKLEKIKKSLRLPPAFQLTAPEFFEDEPWQINLKFKNKAELDRLAIILKNLAGDQSFQKFLAEIS